LRKGFIFLKKVQKIAILSSFPSKTKSAPAEASARKTQTPIAAK